ncbi:MAG: PD-(D/E)XK nuclease family protein [Anaerolineae bacterium]|nr:PD-(D/E)XK nuclease family protein [Anaerolineae bacterium]
MSDQVMLPPGFEFSQASLQDYVDCKRRFQLKYLEGQPWPAVEVEPVLAREAYAEQGRRFHHLIERYYAGVPFEVLEASLGGNADLRRWWRALLAEPPLNLPEGLRLPEVRLSIPLAGQRLVAVFDLLAIDQGKRLVIVDWKTGRRLPRQWFDGRLQSMVYPFVAVEAGARFFGGPVDPARVTMVFWFADEAEQPHVFHYDADRHEANRAYLEGLLREVVAREGGVLWPLVGDEAVCGFCEYRSLCGRGVAAAQIGDVAEYVNGAGLMVGDVELGLDVVDEVGY